MAALNWGLGHAARCIPIISELEKQGFEPFLASDGEALLLLEKEFPHLESFRLPSYNIEYSTKGSLLKWKLFLETPAILQAIKAEKKMTSRIVEKCNINGIISDSRFGVRHAHLKSVFITHQLNVLSGNTTYLSSKLHQKYIRKFDQCWVPDMPGSKNLSGLLGHMKKEPENIKYIGPISRFEKKDLPLRQDYLVLLSGPEPQRSLLEDILLKELQKTEKNVLFVRGVMKEDEMVSPRANFNIRNYMYGAELEEALNSSRMIISRSGYTTLMDLAKLEKKAFFIPTPGQFEQEYLAERLMKLGITPYCAQKDFSIEKLKETANYTGLRSFGFEPSFRELFAFFKSE
ncbi:MAG: glycosyltransferase [Salegentibacter sp.]